MDIFLEQTMIGSDTILLHSSLNQFKVAIEIGNERQLNASALLLLEMFTTEYLLVCLFR